jgi:ribosomal protein S18 acetylase RimI-like enzyme
MTRFPGITFRHARDADVERTYEVFLEAADDLSARSGRAPRAGKGAPPKRAIALRRSCVRHDGERFWVAEADGRVIGFAIAILRDDVWHLAALHVAPEFQAGGIGTELTRRSMAGTRPSTALTVITDAVNPISNALYMRAGMLFQDAMLTFDAPNTPSAPAPDGDLARAAAPDDPADATAADRRALDRRPINLTTDQPLLASIDLSTIGFARPMDHELWASIEGLAGMLLLRGGVVVGYAYASAEGAIGPLAVHDPADLQPALTTAAAVAREAGATSIHVRIPGSARLAADWLVAHGARLSGIGLFLASRPVGRLDRYVTSGGDAFY